MSKHMKAWKDEMVDASASTIRIYETWLGRFLEHVKMTPDEFYKFHLDATRSDEPFDHNATRRLLKEYLKSIEDKYKPSTRTHVVKAVQSFITAQGFHKIDMNNKKKKRIFYDGAANYEAEEFRRAIDRTTLRNKAIILTIKDSGLRVSDIVNLNVGDARTDESFILMDLTVEKTGFPAKPCLGPEALEAIRDYLATRSPPSDDAPLFIQVQHENLGKRMTAGGMASRIKKVGTSAGFDKMSSNSFRKWNTTSLQRWVNPIWLKILQGRAMPTESEAHYTAPTDEQLLSAYRENYDKLRFYERKISKSEVEDLKGKVDLLADQAKKRDLMILQLLSEQDHELSPDILELLKEIKNIWEIEE